MFDRRVQRRHLQLVAPGVAVDPAAGQDSIAYAESNRLWDLANLIDVAALVQLVMADVIIGEIRP